ncbi:ferritin-like domain-containing protein [Sphingomonas sp. MMS12-HWE2-04]|uniref:ferritin-like domain-containing protein n=1 Tax=Sphingomonas sp. MMS12-HWE2-04 TaxID=3234199 RepID=UPI003850A83D
MRMTHVSGALSARDTKYIEVDSRVVRWIAQAAVDVELFTIPLYMTSLYSISGMHPITGQGNAFYKGRLWPGAKTSVDEVATPGAPGWGNKRAFNIVFSVFIQEMLHLQMAANLATAIGKTPCFTDTALQTADHGWKCYGPDLTVIPNIVDLTDTSTYASTKVNVGPLDADRIALFLAIEQPQDDAERDIVRNQQKYFPKVPFDGGDPAYDPATAGIMFGSIGYMYQCYRDYLSITYSDGTRLWDHVFDSAGQQNDLFNGFSFPGHPMREFMGFETTIALTDKDIAFRQALVMMNAITDQGEGATLKARLDIANETMLLGAVEKRYCPDIDALRSDYPSYDDTGKQVPSADAVARGANDGADHYERFEEVQGLLDQGAIVTWDKAGKAGVWTGDDLKTADYQPKDCGNLPEPEAIAAALNNLYNDNAEANYATLSQAVVGAIKGVTTVLDQYWAPGSTTGFPFPSMAGSGDRMSTAWAVFGRTPDLSKGIAKPDTNVVNHACQGLSLTPEGGVVGTNACAQTTIFHTCRGSNLCKGMGGCGFVQPTSGGGSCSTSVAAPAPKHDMPGVRGNNCSAVQMRALGGSAGGNPIHYTAPSNNICGGFGGCAVPISAMQLYPKAGTMEIYVLGSPSKPIGTIDFAIGDRVEDIAFQAFSMAAADLGYPAPTQQEPNDLRLAFPPST